MCLAIPGKVIEYPLDHPTLGLVEVSGVRRKVDMALLYDDQPQVGDWVLIHVGFAMSKISEPEAQEQMRILRLLGEDEAAMEEIRGYGLNSGER